MKIAKERNIFPAQTLSAFLVNRAFSLVFYLFPFFSSRHTCVPDSQLEAAAVLGEPVGFGTGGGGHGGHRSGRSLPGNFDRRPQQIDLLPVHVLHVVLHNIETRKVGKLGKILQEQIRKYRNARSNLWICHGIQQQHSIKVSGHCSSPHICTHAAQVRDLIAHSRLVRAQELWRKTN